MKYLTISILIPIWKAACQDVCNPAVAEISPKNHTYAVNNLEVSKISFSSCHLPDDMHIVPNFWSDMRYVSKPDIWLWLGDNMYHDGNDINGKRLEYNKVREEASYNEYGLVSSTKPVIPIMACWDDHDFGYNDAGSDYPCTEQSQAEWAHHVNIPNTEPQHPDSPDYRPGVYNSRMFSKPGTEENGIHVILLDNRSERDPTYSRFGECKGSATQILSDTQWAWLETELEKKSEIKIIGSGVQVLPPTNQVYGELTNFCSHDSHNKDDPTTTTFLDSIARVGESSDWYGVPYEMWGEVPLQRERLLGLTQKSINMGNTKLIIFVSGDPHWAELMVKRMPESESWGPSQVLYEMTASGVPQDWPGFFVNSNRLRDRSADHHGRGPYNQNCQFPFIYNNITYNECTEVDNEGIPWCSVLVDFSNHHVPTFWGNCAPPEEELAQETFSNSTMTCSNNDYFICLAKANYGFIHVDFDNQEVDMSIRTPAEGEQISHKIKY